MWWNIAFFLFSPVAKIAMYLLMPSKGPTNEPPEKAGLDDFNFPTATAGRNIPVVFGRRAVPDANVVWYGDLNVDPNTKSTGSGGKKG